MSAADEDGDMAEGRRDGFVFAGFGVHEAVGVPIVVDLSLTAAGENAIDAVGALDEDRGDEDSGAEEELAVRGGEGGVIWEFPREGAHDGGAGGVGVVEECVHVGEELEADRHCGFGGVDDGGPDVGFLADRIEVVMITVEREESGELHPAVTQFLVRVPLETAGIDAEHGDAEEGEGEGLRDGEEHVRPEGEVIAAPVAGEGARAGEGGAADDEGAFCGEDGEEGVVCCVEDLVAEEVVDVIFHDAVVVGSVGGDGVDGEVALDVVDDVWGMVDVANARGGCRDEVGGGCGGCGGWAGGGGGLGGGCGGGRGGFGRVGEVEAFGVVVDEGAGVAGEREGWVNGVHSYVVGATAADAERGGFGHVDPDSVKGNFVVISNHFVNPPLACPTT